MKSLQPIENAELERKIEEMRKVCQSLEQRIERAKVRKFIAPEE